MDRKHLARDQVDRVLTLSTAHLPPHLLKALSDNDLGIVAYPNDYGGFVYTDELSEHEELDRITALAQKLECDWIKFDCDACIVEELEVFEHE